MRETTVRFSLVHGFLYGVMATSLFFIMIILGQIRDVLEDERSSQSDPAGNKPVAECEQAWSGPGESPRNATGGASQ